MKLKEHLVGSLGKKSNRQVKYRMHVEFVVKIPNLSGQLYERNNRTTFSISIPNSKYAICNSSTARVHIII